MSGFDEYCKNCPDQMLEGVLEKEWEASRGHDKRGASPGKKERYADYLEARRVAEQRGWTVQNGQRIA